MNNSLKGKIALVTGGTKGIGKAIADTLSNAGAQVIITARTAPSENTNGQHFISSDFFQPESAEVLAEEILTKYGRIDIIVNNAGANLSPGGGFSTLSDEHWNSDWQLNF
ncbi:SDR family NAD(P)-dependent oxidoreductase, partial [Flavobacterium sp. B17]|uniref:SDR family NAD(P)-dependent oxidoreductase n=1 Tax=Flavobacterium sp. B17 TaxID=95618 RepID=UPI0005B2C9A9